MRLTRHLRPTATRTGRVALLPCVLLLGVAALGSACTPDDETVSFSGSADPGDDWELRDPMLREDDLALGYDQGSDFSDDDLTRAGCLAAVDALGSSSRRQMAVTFTTDNPFDSPVIKHTVFQFDDSTKAGQALDQWKDITSACEVVEYVQDDSVLTLEVDTDTEEHGSAVDEEVNLIADGEVDTDSFGIALSQWVSVARVGEHLSLVQVLDLDEDDAVDEGHRLAELTSDRLHAWGGSGRATDQSTEN